MTNTAVIPDISLQIGARARYGVAMMLAVHGTTSRLNGVDYVSG